MHPGQNAASRHAQRINWTRHSVDINHFANVGLVSKHGWKCLPCDICNIRRQARQETFIGSCAHSCSSCTRFIFA